MKALVFHKPKDVRVKTVPDPRIEESQDRNFPEKAINVVQLEKGR
jgi:hypothetical protein